MAICRDARTRFQTRFAGRNAEVRRIVSPWWEANYSRFVRPPAVITVVRPNDPFEDTRPSAGVLIRVRLRRHNSPQAAPLEALVRLVKLTVDEKEVATRLVEPKAANGHASDSSHHAELPSLSRGSHVVVATVRDIATQEESEVRAEFQT